MFPQLWTSKSHPDCSQISVDSVLFQSVTRILILREADTFPCFTKLAVEPVSWVRLCFHFSLHLAQLQLHTSRFSWTKGFRDRLVAYYRLHPDFSHPLKYHCIPRSSVSTASLIETSQMFGNWDACPCCRQGASMMWIPDGSREEREEGKAP
jgi:hypothetical protein